MKPNIIILGAHGMLGWQVTKVFNNSNYKIKCQVRNKKSKKNLIQSLNLKKQVKFFFFDVEKDNIKILDRNIKKKDVVINCIGKIKPFINEDNLSQIESAIKVNSLFPLQLLNIIKKKKIKVYQIATDCVYSGKSGNYKEDAIHDAHDIYGKTKSLGEINHKNFFNIRVSIIGKELNTKNSLVEWFISNKNSYKIFGFKDHLWNGVSTNVFANIILTILDKKINIPNKLHIVPNDKVNKYILLNYLKKYYNFKDLKIIKKNSNMTINRVLQTSYKNINNKIWLKTKYKKKLSIYEIVSTL